MLYFLSHWTFTTKQQLLSGQRTCAQILPTYVRAFKFGNLLDMILYPLQA